MAFRTNESTPPGLFDGLEDEAQLNKAARVLESLDARAIVRAAIAAFGDRLIISTAFGAAGLCLLHMSQEVEPKVRAYYIDTGFAFPETRALIDIWVKERQLNLRKVLPVLTPDEQAARYGDALWEREPDRCCAMRKVEPNERALEGADIWVSALRRDQAESRMTTPVLSKVKIGERTVLKLCPMVGWSKNDVWTYVMEASLPYNALHDRGYPSIGCTHCTRAVAQGEDERAGRWSGSAKMECGIHLPKP